jgi:hypothetical protein
MGVWRPKQEATKSIWFRVPASLKQEFDELRQRAESEGMDAGSTFTAALERLAKQLRDELGRSKPGAKEVGPSGIKVVESTTASRANGARVMS